jgi:Rrf2 family cysteine metabolism transcriptional repressor
MVYLARRPREAPVPLPEIARDESIPAAFLERIFAGLRRGGLVSATRGAYGGYQLARVPEAISVADVMAALEGPLSLVGCVPDGDRCDRVDGCASREVWQRLDQAITRSLTAITLKDLTTEATTA